MVDKNHPDRPDDPLLASAAKILSSSKSTFKVQPWREIMPQANAKAKAALMKEAAKKIEAKGVVAPKHARHSTLTSKTPPLIENRDQAFQGHKPAFPNTGVDSTRTGVVQSQQGVDSGAPNSTTKDSTMTTKPKATEPAKTTTPAAKTTPAVDPKVVEAAKAQAKADADTKKKAAADAETKLKADRKAERDKKAADAKAKREADLEAKKKAAAEAGDKRTYFGPMLQLAEKVKSGAYQKGINGQLRSNDDVAIALEGCTPQNVVTLLKKLLTPHQADLATRYDVLNVGQQSMNLRNKLRGFLKTGKVTLEDLKKARDDGGFADAEAAQAARKEEVAKAKAKRDADAKAKADAAAATKAAAEKAAKEKAAEAAKSPAPAAKTTPATKPAVKQAKA